MHIDLAIYRYKFLVVGLIAFEILLGTYAWFAAEDQTTAFFALSVLATIGVLMFLNSPDYSDSYRLSGNLLFYLVGLLSVVIALSVDERRLQALCWMTGLSANAYALYRIWRFQPRE